MTSDARVCGALCAIEERSPDLASGMKLSTQLVPYEHGLVAEQLCDRGEVRCVCALNGTLFVEQGRERSLVIAALFGVHSCGVGAARVLVGVLIVALHSVDDGSLPLTKLTGSGPEDSSSALQIQPSSPLGPSEG